MSAPLSFAGWCLLQTHRLQGALDAFAAAGARRRLITASSRLRADRARDAFAAVSGPISRHQAAGAVARR